MEKEKILKILNNTGKKYNYSAPIEDKYFKNKIDAVGFGVYDNDKNAKHRYCLIINLPKNKKENLYILLMNPSNTYPKGMNNTKNSKFDSTIRNAIKLAYTLEYSNVVILNSFSYIESDSKKANEYYKNNTTENEINKNFIKKLLKTEQNTDLLVACGDKVKKELYDNYIKIINDNIKHLNIKTYAKKLTADGRPRHLSTQSSINRELFNETLKNKKLYSLEIKGDKFKIIQN